MKPAAHAVSACANGAFSNQTIKVRGLNILVPKSSDCVGSLIVAEQKQDIRTPGRYEILRPANSRAEENS